MMAQSMIFVCGQASIRVFNPQPLLQCCLIMIRTLQTTAQSVFQLYPNPNLQDLRMNDLKSGLQYVGVDSR
jgi:hypothetical protein